MDSNLKKLITVYSVFTLALLFITVSAVVPSIVDNNETSSNLDAHHSSSAQVGDWVQKPELILKRVRGEKITDESKEVSTILRSRETMKKLSNGLGSSAPTCKAKCGQCSPCAPIHLVIKPRAGGNHQYYPVVWKCKCGNNIYNPY